MRLWKRSEPEPEPEPEPVWYVELEPRTWMRQQAQSADDARFMVMRLAPYASGPWTVESEAEHGDKP